MYECKVCGKRINKCCVCYACAAAAGRHRLKIKAVDYKGGKCQLCGYNKCLAALVFHHLDPSTKEFNITTGHNKAWSRVKKELDKCILLCQNCHNEVHAGFVDIGSIPIHTKANIRQNAGVERFTKYINEGFYPRIKQEKAARKCKKCNTLFVPEKDEGLYCSAKCSQHSQRRANRPTKEELAKLVWEKPTSQLAKEFGVSDKAVEKWCKNYGIEKPGRGYWAKIRARGGQ